MEKDIKNVVRGVEALEAYLDRMFIAEGLTFNSWMASFGAGSYRARNEVVLSMVIKLRPRRVFEFACAGGHLAELILSQVPSIAHYVCSSFSPRVVAHAQSQLASQRKCKVQLADADVLRSTDMDAARLESYDLLLTTSFEHIQLDRELVGHFPAGAAFVFSVALFDDPEHFRVFADDTELRSRYDDILEIKDIVVTADRRKAVVGTRVPGEPRPHEE